MSSRQLSSCKLLALPIYSYLYYPYTIEDECLEHVSNVNVRNYSIIIEITLGVHLSERVTYVLQNLVSSYCLVCAAQLGYRISTNSFHPCIVSNKTFDKTFDKTFNKTFDKTFDKTFEVNLQQLCRYLNLLQFTNSKKNSFAETIRGNMIIIYVRLGKYIHKD